MVVNTFWTRMQNTSTFQNHLDHKLAILRLSQTSFFISPDDLPTMRIIRISYLFLQYPWTLFHTSLQSCRLWNCKTQLQQPRHQLMLCKDPFKLVKVDVYVYECLGVNERLEPALSFPGQWPQGTGKSSPRSRLMIFKVRHLLTEILSTLLRLQSVLLLFVSGTPHTESDSKDVNAK